MFSKAMLQKFTIALFAALTIWWVSLSIGSSSTSVHDNLIWAAAYQAVAIWGACWGLSMGRHWGGLKSTMGRVITFFACGLLLQAFGQTVFSVYGLFLNQPVPYPSLADIGFFGSIPLYIAALVEIGQASGAGYSMKSMGAKAWAILLPLVGLCASYLFFLRGYVFDWTTPMKIVLDFGYPFGQAVYVSLAVLIYLLSKDFLGGIMKNKVLLIIIALITQYVADFNFLYQFSNNTWLNGGYGDYLYLLSYFLMAYALIDMGLTLDKVRQSS